MANIAYANMVRVASSAATMPIKNAEGYFLANPNPLMKLICTLVGKVQFNHYSAVA
ncbi:hypothetical protein INP77_13755 [Methylophilus sp. 13]|uniref:hypothetical protein n=1 Tax=Methylophilus sp. 13 TaxID=2781018 RepID=UPI0018904E9A|nr:hypothetical protein [Methylophilus sp. 13]MBF5040559.1 hypothetical protein [Methylophilus sp. 13]